MLEDAPHYGRIADQRGGESRVVRIRVDDLHNAREACRLKFDRAFIGILVERLNLANTRLTSA